MCKQTKEVLWCRFCGHHDRDYTSRYHACRDARHNGEIGKCGKGVRQEVETSTGMCSKCKKNKSYAFLSYMWNRPRRPKESKGHHSSKKHRGRGGESSRAVNGGHPVEQEYVDGEAGQDQGEGQAEVGAEQDENAHQKKSKGKHRKKDKEKKRSRKG